MKTIELSQNKTAIVDDADYEWLSQWKWHYLKNKNGIGYAVRKIGDYKGDKPKWTRFIMHREIMRPPANMEIDHINGNTVDNRRSNLRIVTRKQNRQNSRARNDRKSKYKGVIWIEQRQRWRAYIGDGKAIYLGSFESEMEAAKAYDKAARGRFGQYAWVNFKEDTI